MSDQGPTRLRREPPAFRRIEVLRTEELTPRMVRVTFTGAELEGLVVAEPAASVRLVVPTPENQGLEIPAWNGNEFLMADGSRPILRTFTPKRVDTEDLELDLDVVIHAGGAVSAWAAAARPGDPAAVSGPGRGYAIDPDTPAFLLAGDESAIPAIGQLLEAIPDDVPIQVCVELAHPDARLPLPDHAGAEVLWLDLSSGDPAGDALVAAVTHADLGPGTRIWAAGEAAAMQRIRRHVFEERGIPRAHATIRGYWKHGRRGASNE